MVRQRATPKQRAAVADTIHLIGFDQFGGNNKIRRRVLNGFWTLGATIVLFLSICGVIFISEIMADQPPQGPQTPAEAQVVQLLQRIVQEQAEQRTQINQLGAAVTASCQAVQGAQQVTEHVVQEVVQQVQQAFQQGNQTHQEQISQIAQNLHQEQQNQQQQIQTIAQAISGLQQNVTNLTGQVQTGVGTPSLPGSPPQPPPGGAGNAGFPPQGSGQSSADGLGAGVNGPGVNGPSSQQVPPFPNLGGPSASGPQMYNMGGATGGGQMGTLSPAVAYAIQQGGIDNRALGKPQVYDPSNSKTSFQDWSDHIVTMCDGTMPGIYEVMEWVVNTQPRMVLDIIGLKQRFPHIDGLLLDYAESNVFAILSTYTAGEARSLVRQARRPHGMEAWRLLQMRFNPVTVGRQRAHLIKITNPTENVPLEKLGAEIVSWENRICDFESRPAADKVSDSVKMAALTAMFPNRLREHLQLNASRFATYYDLREEVFSFLDHVLPVASTAMDIGALGSTGCWECGSNQHYAKDCPNKQKGGKKGFKGKGGKGFGKGKFGKDGGGKKGKGKGGEKGKGKSKDGKGHKGQKGSQDYKSLNAVTPDPRLGQLQSAYAKAAMEAYQRERNLPVAIPLVAPPPPQVQAVAASGPSSSSGNAQPIGGLMMRSLFALSRLSERAAASVRRYYEDTQNFIQSEEFQWRMRRYMQGSYVVEATIDSGAAASVCPPSTFSEYPHEPAGDQFFVAANGELVPELYKVHPVIVTAEGHLRRTQFSVANVNKILVSAAQICNRGHRIVLDRPGRWSYIEDGETADMMFLEQKDGVYVQHFAVVRPRNLGFRGPAPYLVPQRL